ncbi:MAG TPA: enoyl-CoA hydratase-related protein [Roseiflexaceae bacterium]|jgi:2-(1,2-epoxy-1,2-dihydrophenyl)acetyl-CoA isomerase|nr:enoyl-CoA hydratase-related protein [Roseiflexaceae bacterium]
MNNIVLYAITGSVATITLNRPEARNALNDELLDGLRAAFEQARDEQVRAVVLAGAGKGFCSGADLSVFGQARTPDETAAYISAKYQPLMQAICALPKPVIGAINGVAAGAGAALALACDLHVMAEDASIMMAFSNIGLVPDAGATWFLARLVGYSRAFEIASEAERIGAARCYELGMANRIVPAAELLPAAQAWAERLAQRPTLALGLTKQALYHALESDLLDTIAYEAELQKHTIVSDDHREGVTAFRERRPPMYKGH